MRQQQGWNPASLTAEHSFSCYCPITSAACLLAMEKNGLKICIDKGCIDRTVLAHSKGTVCFVYWLRQDSGEEWWNLPHMKYLGTDHYSDYWKCTLLQQRFLLYCYCMCSLRMLNLICFANGNGYCGLQWNNDLLILCNKPQKSCDDRST